MSNNSSAVQKSQRFLTLSKATTMIKLQNIKTWIFIFLDLRVILIFLDFRRRVKLSEHNIML